MHAAVELKADSDVIQVFVESDWTFLLKGT